MFRFFFAGVYTESFFLCLVLGYFYSLKERKWLMAGVLAALASATKIVGIFLFPILLWKLAKEEKKTVSKILSVLLSPLGLISYMFYLWKEYGDPLMFFHVQPFFGAHRSGEEMILSPQVIYRYLKIFPVFIALESINYKLKIPYFFFSFLLLTLFTAFFLNGYFVS